MSDRWTQLREEFDAWADSYDRDRQASQGLLEHHAQSLRAAADLLVVTAGQELLDIGVGTGAFGALYAERGARVTGVDISPRMLHLAARAHPEWRLLEGHFLALPLADQSCDAAISAFAFHHLEDAERAPALREICRVLRGDAFLLVDIMFPDEAAKDAGRRRLADHWEEENYALFPDLARTAAEVGLSASFTRLSDLHGAALLRRHPRA